MIEDQAHSLRELMKSRGKGCHTIAVTSGKGGVGKTSVALNLAVLAANMGFRSTLLDADLGLANIHVMIDVRARHNISHVIAGKKELEDIMIPGPGGVRFIPGASGIAELADLSDSRRQALVAGLQRLEMNSDIIFIDTSAGIGRGVIGFAGAADRVLVVTTPEPAAVTDAYAIIKTLNKENYTGELGVMVNMVENKISAARTFSGIRNVCQQFLNVFVDDMGYLVSDPHVPVAVRKRMPVVEAFPRSQAAMCLRDVARRVLPKKQINQSPKTGFFSRLLARFKIPMDVGS